MSNPTNRRLLASAETSADLETQLRALEQDQGMQVEAIGIIGSDSTNQTNYADVSSNLDDLPALQVVLVPTAVSADDTQFEQFYQPILQSNTVIDSAMVLLGGNSEHVLLVRPVPVKVPEAAPLTAAAQPDLPDYAQELLSEAKGVPWGRSKNLPTADAYNAIRAGTCRVFSNLRGPGGQPMNVVYYESKLAIDNDGSGPNVPTDPDHQSDTNLHDPRDHALNAHEVPFAVLPLDAAEAAKLHASHPNVQLKLSGLPDMQRELGLKIGDIGLAFWREESTGETQQAAFIYGDKGPANFLGEGSVHLADLLQIYSHPVKGGIGPDRMQQLGKGIVHLAFSGSGTGVYKSSLVPDGIEAQAKLFWEAFVQQTESGS